MQIPPVIVKRMTPEIPECCHYSGANLVTGQPASAGTDTQGRESEPCCRGTPDVVAGSGPVVPCPIHNDPGMRVRLIPKVANTPGTKVFEECSLIRRDR